MRCLIAILFLLLTCIPAGLARDAEADRYIPPDFPEIDFGIAVAGDHFKVKVFNDCNLTGQATGGLWVGHQVSPTEWDADLQVPFNYARSHHGVFFGTYKVCGGGGGGYGVPPPLVWHGSAGAGHYFVGPMALQIAYIHSFSIRGELPDFIRWFIIAQGHAPNIAERALINGFLELLELSTNPEPPTVFGNELIFDSKFVPTKEYRGYNKTCVRIKVDKDNNIIDFDLFGNDQSSGYTPVRTGITTIYPAGAYGYSTGETVLATNVFVNVTKQIDMRLNLAEAFAAYESIGLHFPYVWQYFTYRINSDGTYKVVFHASHMPTTSFYISNHTVNAEPTNWQQVFTVPQSNVGRFSWYEPSLIDTDESNLSPFKVSGIAIAQ